MILQKYEKQPAERKDYDIDFSEWLSASDDTLDEVVTRVECLTDPADEALVVDLTEMTTTRLKLWLSGGTHNYKYKITALVTTVGQRTDESELIFVVKDR